MDLILKRRTFLGGMLALFAAPAIVRASSLMPVKAIRPDWLIVPLQNYYDLPSDVREAIGRTRYVVPHFGDFLAVPNNSLVRRSFNPAVLHPRSIIANKTEWFFPDFGHGYDPFEKVYAPDSWT